jgi:DNA primase
LIRIFLPPQLPIAICAQPRFIIRIFVFNLAIMITPATIQKINDEARVEDIVGEFVSLKKRGVNLIGNCPFHNEKTPSFYVSPTKGIYKCFGCGKAGGAINFLMENQQMTYVEALRYVANRYNIEVEETELSEEVKEQINTRESVMIASSFAQKFYTDYLLNNEEGKNIGLSYFKERGFSEKTIEKFQLGFAPTKRDAFTKHALANGFQIDILKKACLTSKGENSTYDFFYDRVMFPIHDVSGRVIAFGGRTLRSDKTLPKYINTAESEAYEKSKVLYGISYAKHAIRKEDTCFLCEGYTDVISLHQAGVENTVSSSGTALTPDQIKLIKRFTDNITILYDGDAAGIKAALRGVDLAIEGGLNVRLVLLPDGEDPDSFVQKLGETAFREFILKNQKDFILFKTTLFFDEAKDDPIKRADLTRDIIATIAKIQEPLKRNEYIKECSRIMDVREQLLLSEVSKLLRKAWKEENKGESLPISQEKISKEEQLQHEQQFRTSKPKHEELEKNIIRILAAYGPMFYEDEKTVTQEVLEQLDVAYFENEDFKTYFNLMIDYYDKGLLPSTEELLNNEENRIKNMTIHIFYQPYDISPNWEVKHQILLPSINSYYIKDVKQSIALFKIEYLNKQIEIVKEKLKNSTDLEEEKKNTRIYMKMHSEKMILSKIVGTVIHAKNN